MMIGSSSPSAFPAWWTLSGMVPGGYSATIDYAPPTFMPGFDFGPLFLLRHVFETCDTYDDACYTLSHTKLSANVLFIGLFRRRQGPHDRAHPKRLRPCPNEGRLSGSLKPLPQW